ncbi:FlxA-like family protein [Acetatifactor muris]|uniref:FlxA-like family protein n=1 Tax=Acetatifactor muris TaxID=879566 RepID=UPI0023F1A423|nr:hypothetical protein [Acetatifactor muris]
MGISSVGTLENAAISRSRMAVQRAEVRQNRGTGQKAAAQPADVVSKNIQNEISEVQRQKQGLSSKQEMSEGERSKKKQELQQELSSLNTRLRQRQAEVSRKQKQADRLEELSAPDTDMRTRRAEGSNTGKTAQNSKAGKNTEQSMGTEASFTKEAAEKMAGTGDAERSAGQTKRNAGQIRHSTEQTKRNAEKTERSSEDDRDEKSKTGGIPQDKMQAIVGGDIFREQTERREVVIARIEGGIAILKGEIRQDEMLGNDVQNKKTELKAREAKVKNAANGLPVVNAPGRKSDKILRNAGRVKAEAEEHVKNRILKTSPDGVVVLKSDNGTLQFR